MSFLLVIPTCNAQKFLPDLMRSISVQTVRPDVFLIIDSASDDDTVSILREEEVVVHIIGRNEFNHGGTRQLAVEMFPETDLIVFLTQDAVLADPESLERLLGCFDDASIGAAYGRQLPRPGAGSIEAHARLFNYPPESRVKTVADSAAIGIKTVFISNSFAVYRRSALNEVGGFPLDTICTEDTYVAAKMVLSGWKIAYCAEARVYHSHDYTWLKEFRRYYDIGYFYGKESWIGRTFGGAEGEGKKFFVSEFHYLLKQNKLKIPSAFLRTALKLMGCRLGAGASRHPQWLRKLCSMNRNYWSNQGITNAK